MSTESQAKTNLTSTLELNPAFFEITEEESETAIIYRREAGAIYKKNPERAAIMLLNAAYANERDALPDERILRDLSLATQLQPEQSWVLATVRRFLLKMDGWKQAISLIERELKLTQDSSFYSSLCLEAANICWIVANNTEAAIDWVKRALECTPNHVGALYTAVSLYYERNALAEAAIACQNLAPHLSSPTERAIILCNAANIQRHLNNHVQSLHLLERSLQSDPLLVHAQILLALCKEEQNDPIGAASACEHVAGLLENPPLKSTFLRRASLLVEHAPEGDVEKAVRLLEAAIQSTPDDIGLRTRVLELYTSLGAWLRAVETLQKCIDLTQSANLKAAFYLTQANIYEDQLSQPQKALLAYAMARQLDPKLRIAFDRMRALLEKDELWNELQSHYQTLIDESSYSAEKDTLYYLAADAANLGGNPESAVKILLESKELPSAFWCLLYLLESQKEWDQLSCLIEQYIKIAKDPKTVAALSLKLSNIYAHCLHSKQQALGILKNAVKFEESRGIVFNYILRLHDMQQFEALSSILLKEALKTLDDNEKIAWQLESALLCDRRLKDPVRALDILGSLLKHYPTQLTIIEAMRDVAWHSGHWEALLVANRARNEILMDEENVSQMLCESAFACEKLGDIEEACSYYAASQKIKPLSLFGMMHYTSLLKRLSLHERRYAIFADTARASSDEAAAYANLMAADIAAFQLQNHAQALVLYRTRFEQEHDISDILSLVFEKKRDHQRHEAIPELLEALNLYSEEEETRALLQWSIAQTQSYFSDEKNRLILFQECFRQKFGITLRAEIMQRIRCVEDANIAAWLETYADLVQDKSLSLEMLREASLRYLWVEDDFDSAQRTAAAAFSTNRDDLQTLWELERFAAITEDWNALAQIREKLSHFENNPIARVQTLSSAIIPYIDANLPQHAARISLECLKFDAHSFPALLTLAMLFEESSNWSELAKTVDRLTEASAHPLNRHGYGLWGAKIWDKYCKSKNQALASLELILTQNPASLPAIAYAESLLIQLGDATQLSRLYSRAINALPKGNEQVELLKKHAALLAQQLQNVPAATTELKRVLEQSPDDLTALASQSEYLCQLACWTDAILILEHWGRVNENLEEKKAINIRQATILVKKLSQLGQAKRLLSKHLNLFPHDIQALKLLFDIANAEGNWKDAQSYLDELTNTKNENISIWAHIESAKLARKANWDNNIRIECEKTAIKSVLRHRDFFDQLCVDYEQNKEIPRLIAAGQRAMEETTDGSLIAEYQGCIAAFMVANKQYKEALAFLSNVIKEDLNTDWAFLARAQALYCAGQYKSSASEFRRTLCLNMQLIDAFSPFIEVLRLLNNKISQSAVSSLHHHLTGRSRKPSLRCIQGVPRGVLHFDILHAPRQLVEAERYLRIMAQPILKIYQEDEEDAYLLPSTHPAAQRCRMLFGQMLDVKAFYRVRAQTGKAPIRLKMDSPLAFLIDETIIEDDSPRFDFWAGVTMHQTLTGAGLLNVIDNDEVTALFRALCQVKPEDEHSQSLKKWLWKLIPRSDRKPFKDGVPFLAPDWNQLRDFLNDHAACVGTIISASPDAALEAMPESKRLQQFLISEDFERYIKLYWEEQL